MDKRMIKLAQAKWDTLSICDMHLKCDDCPFYVQGMEEGCICYNKEAFEKTKKECWAEEEAHGTSKFTEIMSAKAVLEAYCNGNDGCEGCAFYTADGGCRVGAPMLWDGKAPENYKDGKEEQYETDTEPKEATPAEKRKRVLDEAVEAVCRDRCEMYGEVEDNFGVIAEMWNTYLNAGLPEGACKIDLGAKQVAEMMILFKVGRAATAMEDHRDTYVDIAGYAACAGGMCDEKDV